MAVLQPGQKLGPYRLGERISRGGMGEVWRAVKGGEGGWEKSVALKLILPTLDEERFAAMFLAEARIAAALDHANIVPVFGFGREGDLLYIEMEQIVGQDLRHILLRSRAPLPLAHALFVTAEALKGLAYAHERGVVHRDVKPHNTLVSYEGHVKLTDFGIAKVAAETGAGVSRSEVKGTAGYIAPELLDGKPASARSDLFAVGLVLWECLTGKKLFDGASEAERLRRTFDSRIPLLREVVPDAPVAVEELALRLLAREPSARFATAREALAVLLAAPGGRAASSEEMKALMGRLFAAEAAAAAAEASAASASLRARRASTGGSAPSASPADGVPREILDDGPRVRSAPGEALAAAAPAPVVPPATGRTPTPAGEERHRVTPLGRAGRAWWLAGLGVAAAASVAFALARWPERAPAAGTLAPATAPVAAAPAPVAPPPAETASVVIEVTPHDVRLVVDGRVIPGVSPFALAAVPRGATLAVRVERDGYLPVETTLTVDAPVVRQPIELVPAAPAPEAAAPVPAPGARRARPRSVAPETPAAPAPATIRPTRPVDDDGTMVPPPP